MVKVCPELRAELIGRGLWSAFVAACERRTDAGVGGASARDDAIDEVCPDLVQFKGRKRKRMFEAVSAREDERNDASCNGYRLLEWVVENFEHRDSVTERMAPSRAAWAILQACGRDDDTYRDVLKKYLDSKIKADSAAGDTDTRRIDGQKEYDILEGLKLEVGE